MVDDVTVDPGGVAGAEDAEEVEAVSLPHQRTSYDQGGVPVLLFCYEIKYSYISFGVWCKNTGFSENHKPFYIR